LWQRGGELLYRTSIKLQDGDWFLLEYDGKIVRGVRSNYKPWYDSIPGSRPDRDKLGRMPRDRVGLILRVSPEIRRYTVVGMAFPVSVSRKTAGMAVPASTPQNFITIEKPKCFVLWWHHEDLLAMGWRSQCYQEQETASEQIEACVRLATSAKQKATFAHGPYEISDIRTMLEQKNGAAFLEPLEISLSDSGRIQ
jgi:hypothetical protein